MSGFDDELDALGSGEGDGSFDDELSALDAPPAAPPNVVDMPGRTVNMAGLEAEDSTPGWIKALRAAMPGSVMSQGAKNPGVMAAAQGIGHGVTMGLDQNLPGYGDYVRDERAQAAQAAPEAYAGGDLAGSLMSPGNFGSTAKAGMASAALQGASRDFSDADPSRSLGERAGYAAAQGAGDAGVTGLLTAGLSGAGGAVGALAKAAKAAGLEQRVAATGRYGADMRKLVKNKGRDYVQKLGQEIEDRGLHKGEGLLGMLPQPAATYEDNAERLLASAGPRMGAAEDAIGAMASPPQVPLDGIVNKLDQRGAEAASLWDPAGAAEAKFRGQLASNMRGGPIAAEAAATPMAEWPEAVRQRRGLDDQIDWNRAGGYEGAPMQEAVRREAAGGLRSGISSSLDDAVDAGQMPAALRDQWSAASNDWRVGSDVLEPARKRELQELGNQAVSLPTWAGAAAGGMAGGAYGMMTGDPREGMHKAALGALSASLIKSRGHAAMAGAGRLTGQVAGPLGAGLSKAGNMAMRAPTGTAVAMAMGGGASPAYSQEHSHDNSRGDKLSMNVEQMMQAPNSPLAPWAEQLSGVPPERRAALVERLARTDERFASQVMPLLNGAGATR